jgi:hypothetical protein
MQLNKVIVTVVSFLLLSVPVVPVTASTAEGQMLTKGNAKINGVPAPSTTSVFVGDRVATEKDTTTSVSFSGGDALVMLEMSKAAIAETGGHALVSLEDGSVSALNKSGKPIVIEAHGARITSVGNQGSIFDVILHGNSLRVIARGGVARVETANRTADLRPGTELDATLGSPDPAPNPRSPGAAGFSHATTWLLVAATAAGVTGLALGIVAIDKTNNCRLSPSTNKITC